MVENLALFRTLIIIGLLSYMSCHDQGCNSGASSGSVGVGVDMDAVLELRGGQIIAEACTLVDHEDIAKALGLELKRLEITDSTNPDANRTASSCFFKWNDNDLPNAGILVQVQRNIYPDEYPDYIIGVVESKKTSGENGLSQEAILFDDFPDIGDDGAFSYKAGSAIWRLGNKVMFSISFNTTFPKDKQYRIARTIAAKMTENYIAGR